MDRELEGDSPQSLKRVGRDLATKTTTTWLIYNVVVISSEESDSNLWTNVKGKFKLALDTQQSLRNTGQRP